MSSPIKDLPDDVLSYIFHFLPPKDLARVGGVCKNWRELASDKSLWNSFDLKKLFPKLSIIDGDIWQRYVDLARFRLSLDDATPLDKRVVIEGLTALFKLDVEGGSDKSVTLLTLPKGLTFNDLFKIAASPKEGNPTGFRQFRGPVPGQFGDLPVEKTITVALSNNILNGSRNLSYIDQKKLVEDKGCEMPGLLPATTLAFLTYIMSDPSRPPTRLYNDDPWTYTRCLEQIEDRALLVGGFSTHGLAVGLDNSVCDEFGVGALRKF